MTPRLASIATVLLLGGGAASCSSAAGPAEPVGAGPAGRLEPAEVAFVIDGDTLELEDGRRVRLVGIDTPERDECLYDDAKRLLARMVDGETVGLQRDRSDTDRFGRTLRYIWRGEELVNERLVDEGLAVARVYGDDDLHADRLAEAQRRAREAQRGLWGAACG